MLNLIILEKLDIWLPKKKIPFFLMYIFYLSNRAKKLKCSVLQGNS